MGVSSESPDVTAGANSSRRPKMLLGTSWTGRSEDRLGGGLEEMQRTWEVTVRAWLEGSSGRSGSP